MPVSLFKRARGGTEQLDIGMVQSYAHLWGSGNINMCNP